MRLTDLQQTIEIEDNDILARVVGPFSQFLAEIESATGVKIAQRGNVLSFSGENTAIDESKGVIKALQSRAKSGLTIEVGDVQGSIRMVQRRPLPNVAEPLPKDAPVEIRTRRKIITPRSPRQDVYIRALSRAGLSFGIGPAGTGKSYLAVAAAVAAFSEKRVSRIILSRPAVEAGERLGFLPGDMKEKVDPYLRPLYDALHDTLGAEQTNKCIESGQIEIAPLAFMRGRTLADSFVLLDEAQNCTRMQMKMFLTRLGDNSRMAVTGDPSQIDLPRGEQSGLVEALSILSNVKDIEIVRFAQEDVVRHPLVARIVGAYDRHDQQKQT